METPELTYEQRGMVAGLLEEPVNKIVKSGMSDSFAFPVIGKLVNGTIMKVLTPQREPLSIPVLSLVTSVGAPDSETVRAARVRAAQLMAAAKSSGDY